MSSNELGSYLRSCREAVSPAEVGLPGGGRRRTPGLRRAELATLAGISVEYLIRLEQGRDRHPSAQVLGALADALGLDGDDRLHLLRLAKDSGCEVMCPTAPSPVRAVRPTVRALLDSLEPTPAVLLNRLHQVLAHTTGYERLAGPVGILDGTPPSLLRYVFTDPRAREAFADWDGMADEMVACLKISPGPMSDPYMARVLNEMAVVAGAAFTDRMAGVSRPPRRAGHERFVHPEAGMLSLAYETLDVAPADGERLLVYLPADAATSDALDGLTRGRPRALRAVSG